MTRLARDNFLARQAGRFIDLDEANRNPTLGRDVKARLQRADLNRDGKISGTREMDKLFTELDQLDRDGSHHSIDVGSESAPTALGRTLTELESSTGRVSSSSATTPLARLVEQQPNLETHQDLINHFMRVGGGDWDRSQRVAAAFGRDLNELVRDRSAPINADRPAAAVGSSELEKLRRDNPGLKTNQDLINHFLRAGRRSWRRATALAARFGVDLNAIAAHRDAPIHFATPTQPAGSDNPTATARPPVPLPTPPAQPVAQPTAPLFTPASNRERVVPSGKLGAVYRANERGAGRAKLRLTRNHKTQINRFLRNFEQNRARYETVAGATGIPAQMVAAIHYRESSMSFGTYLHQGDPLGRPATHVPRNIPVFDRWEDAAIHALKQKDGTRRALGITADTTDPAALATFVERYNGLAYHNRKRVSPYVWSGTTIYQGGRYVADHRFDARSWDRRPGVMALMAAANGVTIGTGAAANQTPEQAWAQVTAGNERLRRGVRSEAVTYLQAVLQGLGYPLTVDGDYGRATRAAVRAFQEKYGLDADGVVGPTTAAKISEIFGAL